ncbi:MAG: hypothetical protein BWY82_01632 [Verrucomicrobia bacterium ADurb.Bin474]|nr:MAG: hypothetical protein BWY82_01632 [Verrucomicrobia bacterium ADurb.Bin474]
MGHSRSSLMDAGTPWASRPQATSAFSPGWIVSSSCMTCKGGSKPPTMDRTLQHCVNSTTSNPMVSPRTGGVWSLPERTPGSVPLFGAASNPFQVKPDSAVPALLHSWMEGMALTGPHTRTPSILGPRKSPLLRTHFTWLPAITFTARPMDCTGKKSLNRTRRPGYPHSTRIATGYG